jgi:hypothetical protein
MQNPELEGEEMSVMHHFTAEELEKYRVLVASRASAETSSIVRASMGQTLDRIEDEARRGGMGVYRIPIWRSIHSSDESLPPLQEPDSVVLSTEQVHAVRRLLCGPRP